MVRFVIIGVVIAVAFTLYALVDAAMTNGARARGVSKPIWIILVIVLPVVGGILWFMIGKGAPLPTRSRAPEDEPGFVGTSMSADDLDVHMRDLEARLRELDNETFPGEDSQKAGAAGADAADVADAAAGERAEDDLSDIDQQGSSDQGPSDADADRVQSAQDNADVPGGGSNSAEADDDGEAGRDPEDDPKGAWNGDASKRPGDGDAA